MAASVGLCKTFLSLTLISDQIIEFVVPSCSLFLSVFPSFSFFLFSFPYLLKQDLTAPPAGLYLLHKLAHAEFQTLCLCCLGSPLPSLRLMLNFRPSASAALALPFRLCRNFPCPFLLQPLTVTLSYQDTDEVNGIAWTKGHCNWENLRHSPLFIVSSICLPISYATQISFHKYKK